MTSLEELLRFANDISALGVEKFGGMASLNVFYNPYDSEWIAKVNWSSGYEIITKQSSLKRTLLLLAKSLHSAYLDAK